MQSLGADEAVNYREQDIAELFKDPSKHFDAIVDLVGGQLSERCPLFHSSSTHQSTFAPQAGCVYHSRYLWGHCMSCYWGVVHCPLSPSRHSPLPPANYEQIDEQHMTERTGGRSCW